MVLPTNGFSYYSCISWTYPREIYYKSKGKREKCTFKEFSVACFWPLGSQGKFDDKARSKLEKFFQGHLAMQSIQEIDALIMNMRR
jgi:hypothetical protein